MSVRLFVLCVGLLLAFDAAAGCYTVGTTTTCTAAPGVTRTVTGTHGRGRIVSSNAGAGAVWERHLADEDGYRYAFGTDPEGNRWVSGAQRKPHSLFTLWPDKSAAVSADAPLPGRQRPACDSGCD